MSSLRAITLQADLTSVHLLLAFTSLTKCKLKAKHGPCSWAVDVTQLSSIRNLQKLHFEAGHFAFLQLPSHQLESHKSMLKAYAALQLCECAAEAESRQGSFGWFASSRCACIFIIASA